MLNLLNRLIVSVLLIVLIVLLVAFAVTPEGVAMFLARQLEQVQVAPVSVEHLVLALICFALAALGLVLLRLQWRRVRPRTVRLVGTGSTEVASESVVERLRQDVEVVPQVRQALPTIEQRGQAVDVGVEVRTDHDVDVPSKASEVEQVVRDSLARLGLKVGRVRIKIVVGRPTGSPSAASPP